MPIILINNLRLQNGVIVKLSFGRVKDEVLVSSHFIEIHVLHGSLKRLHETFDDNFTVDEAEGLQNGFPIRNVPSIHINPELRFPVLVNKFVRTESQHLNHIQPIVWTTANGKWDEFKRQKLQLLAFDGSHR